MAEVLIFIEDRTTGDIDKDFVSVQQGDVLSVKPDGWVWSAAERQPPFLVVELPGLAVEPILELIGSDPPGVPDVNDPTGESPNRQWRFRRYRVDLAKLEAAQNDPIRWSRLLERAEDFLARATAAEVVVAKPERTGAG